MPAGIQVNVPSTWSRSAYSYAPQASQAPVAPVAPPGYGYSAAHNDWAAQKKIWSAKAYQSTAPPAVILRFQLMHGLRGKTKGQLIGNISEGCAGVSADSTIKNIREAGMQALSTKIVRELGGFDLDWSSIELQEVNSWVTLDRYPETIQGPYLHSHCTKASAKGKEPTLVFKKKAVDLAFIVDPIQWQRIEEFLDKTSNRSEDGQGYLSAEDEDDDLQPDSEISGPFVLARAEFTMQRTRSTDSSGKRARSVSVAEPSTPPQRKRQAQYQSPDQQRLRAALEIGGSSTSQISGHVQTTSERITFFSIVPKPLQDLLTASRFQGFICDPQQAVQGVLNIVSNEYLGHGAFKTAQLGYLTLSPIAHHGLGQQSNEKVVSKRPYTNGEQTGSRFQIARFDSQDEYKAILMEANVLQWSTSIFGLSDDFIQNFITHNGQPPFKILYPRFIHAGVALVHSALPAVSSSKSTSNVARSYLVEELIDGHRDNFRKFIANRSAKPLASVLAEAELAHVAEFLSFTQHVQYWKTKAMVYLSDLQGTVDLLTDPQIMTTPELANGADLFGEGNVAAAFEAFPREHECNKFCTWFQVPKFVL
ncbi:hypothetical protein GGX14DRAFT_701589 [Mycena pura]|uniref:Alpha-type protein kinase domain-containing protein n=1 Tax=Mycena pura TaxID=153505 RepID=A0AAD6UNM1_9AGAR|nr:hypothetical protein GGX14DRAFT_701589 [Mycena pura]